MGRRLAGDTVAEKLKLNHRIEGECWRWTGAHTPKGYGQLAVGGKRRAVHQLAYEMAMGPIRPGLEIDHLCSVRDCINPAHLEAVTHAENIRRAVANSPETWGGGQHSRCGQGHALTPDNVKWRSNKGRRYRTCRRCWNDRRAKQRARAREAISHG